jgi:hypothetical protein
VAHDFVYKILKVFFCVGVGVGVGVAFAWAFAFACHVPAKGKHFQGTC